ncbi:Metallo-dependent phosphatase [Annulohypoxylon maeteangense]|uniref:Metallo-dependent phosphatase n=1 Tax=Annulohypoxylon maeteangense TaxID=1927788 RepID=UPI002008922A|nr:Metallo-dependent phosphatase [Annulohypoxylon maeteangense]KAI0884060.1 Metallo-dependent phosphatase [Annulohypoxylon maeteangense]
MDNSSESSSAVPQQTRRTRFVCISDTHNCTVKLPKGDVLIHCGDLTNQGSFSELKKQVTWLEKADFECKLVIAGNHDLTLDTDFFEQYGDYFHNNTPQNPVDCQNLLIHSKPLVYLRHSSQVIKLTSPSGPRTTFNVFGSPYIPSCGRWAFQYPRSDSTTAEGIWKDIPLNTDILITHGPARTHRDESRHRESVGCESLRQAMWRVRPRLALCGHVHEARGVERVRWDLSNKFVRYKELATTFQWEDPGAGNNKNCLVNLAAKGGMPLDNDGSKVPSSSLPFPTISSTPASPVAEGSAMMTQVKTQGIIETMSEGASPGLGTRGLGGSPISARSDGPGLISRLGRRETCVVNCAIQASSYPHSGPRRLHKPIIVDIDLPVWENNS